MQRRKPGLRLYAEALIVTVMMATLARTFLAQGLRIGSGSMEEALLAGDHVLVNRFVFTATTAPRWIRALLPARAARRGEVVVMRLPAQPGTVLVKRCVGLPGDRVARDGRETVLDGYFVLGDRRHGSYDSRSFGPVPARAVVGKPLFVYWSWAPNESSATGTPPALLDVWRRTRWRRTLRLVR